MACPIGCGARRCTHTLNQRVRVVHPKRRSSGWTSASERRNGGKK